MVGLPRKKSKMLVLTGFVFLAQCCCCILPVRWQVENNRPEYRQVIERIAETLPEGWLEGTRGAR